MLWHLRLLETKKAQRREKVANDFFILTDYTRQEIASDFYADPILVYSNESIF